MKQKSGFFQTLFQTDQNRIALRGGSYSLIMTAIVSALLIVANIFVSILPTTWTKFDMSASKLYSITSNTKAVVNGLNQDITIYWIVQSGKEDKILENVLGKYESISNRIRVVKKNPDIYPQFTKQYIDEILPNNSLIVESEKRHKVIKYSDIYIQKTNAYTFSSTTSFDGEGAITSAIDYVVNEKLPQLYLLEGHGENELPSVFSKQLERENIQVQSLSLLKVDTIPEDAAALMIHAPRSDISKKEKDILLDYVKNGGKLLVMAGPMEDGILENLYSLLTDYNVETHQGIVIEGDRAHHVFQLPFMLIPDMESNEITDPLIEEKYYPVLVAAQGVTVKETENSKVTPLLNTSDVAFSKLAGFASTNYEKEEGDIDGPFTLALLVEEDNDGKMIWFTTSNLVDDTANEYSSGANVDLAINALSSLIGESEAMAIRSKSLDFNYLTISESTSSLLKVIMIGVCPLLYLGIGIYVVIRRRRLHNETL